MTERRTTAIRITTSTIRELTERLDELINSANQYQTTKNIQKTSETLINGWTILKNLAEKKKKKDSVAPQPQYNQGQYGHDLSPEWEWKTARKWKNSDHPEYDTEEILKAGETTEEALWKKTKRVQQALAKDIVELLGQGDIVMTKKEYTALQKAWKTHRRNE